MDIFVQLRSRQCHTGMSPLTLDAIKMKPQFLLSQIYITSYNRFLQCHRKIVVTSFQGAFSESSKDAKNETIPNPYPIPIRSAAVGFFEGTNGKVFPNDICWML